LFTSYNIPSDAGIRALLGYDPESGPEGLDDHKGAPRARLFARLAPQVRGARRGRDVEGYSGGGFELG
jgi:hypothetical protein